MTFIELYENEKNKPTPRDIFIEEVARVTRRSRSTVTKWVVGITRPDYPVQALLAHHFKRPVEELFPPFEANKEYAEP